MAMKPVAYLATAALLGGTAAVAWALLAPAQQTVVASVEILNNSDSEAAAPPVEDPTAPIDVPESESATPDAAAAPAAAPPVICPGHVTPEAPTADGRLFGHFPYAEAPGSALVSVPAALSGGNCQQMHRDVIPDLTAMIAAARAEGVSFSGLSCFRSVARQRAVFCDAARLASAGGIAGRARSSAPPGYSEHATGYALDLGDRASPGTNLEASFAGTKAGRWLAANARRYNFEMSFPRGNRQGVTFEPWHFRWVGNGTAQSTFATASAAFPGQ